MTGLEPTIVRFHGFPEGRSDVNVSSNPVGFGTTLFVCLSFCLFSCIFVFGYMDICLCIYIYILKK